ncbi:MAG: toxin-antitoxin system HicB family antitoxin [Betaproteobacteria bacterium]|nr:toxin-antitoxin system HicB family antitoxin [Betaproteobacteria bacterium]
MTSCVSLHAELGHAAKMQGVSLNQHVLYLLTKGHGERGKRAA